MSARTICYNMPKPGEFVELANIRGLDTFGCVVSAQFFELTGKIKITLNEDPEDESQFSVYRVYPEDILILD